MKTKKEWKGILSEYLEVGDDIDQELANYFLEVLPPAFWENGIIQIGEPFDHDQNGRPRFLTIQKIENKWTYRGICRKGQVQP